MNFSDEDVVRFALKLRLVGECTLWMGGKDKDGYGVFYAQNKSFKAHRASYRVHKGPFDLSLCVLHRCDNPWCVNPDHLFLGTVTDNNKDRHTKGRSKNKPTPGESHNMAKLTEEDVHQIRQAVSILQKELAETFGVSVPTISNIKSRKTWTHV